MAVLATGCVGVTDREDFDALVDSRGGGLSSDLVLSALDAAATEVGVAPAELELTSITINPGSRNVVMTVRDPVQRGNLDRYLFSTRDGLGDPEPVQVRASDDLDAAAFRVGDVPALGRTEEMADAAFAALGFEEPHVESITGSAVGGAVVVHMSVESARASGSARFGADGALIEAVRS